MSDYTVIRDGSLPHGRVKFFVSWMGRPLDPKSENEISVTLSQDGCMGVTVEKRYLCPGEAEAFADAILQARREYENRRVTARKKWDHENGDLTRHFGMEVSLSINSALSVLETALIDGGKIFHNGVWLHMCRTDLKDDVRISLSNFDREYLKSLVGYGARIDGDLFAIISGFSDG